MASDRTQAFDAIAENYRRHRPSYPQSMMEAVKGRLDLQLDADAPRVAVDVGSGTGIATRQLAEALGNRWQVVGIEPGRGMITEADPGPYKNVWFQEGRAEALPLEAGSAALVLAAQAAQWFDRPRFYAEARRILSKSGQIALLQNNRDWRKSKFLDEYENLLEAASPGYSRDYRDFDFHHELVEDGWDDVEVRRANWSKPSSSSDFIGMALSSSKVRAAVEHSGEHRIRQQIADLLAANDMGDVFEIPYVTELFMARRPSGNGDLG